MSDAAIASIVTGLVTVTTLVVGFLTLWLKLKYDEEKKDKTDAAISKKIDDNTHVTMIGTTEAAKNAGIAALTADEAKQATVAIAENINKKLNGGIDSAVADAIEPVHKMLKEHSEKIDNLEKYVHERNHDLLGVIQAQSNKLTMILNKLNENNL